MKVHKTWEHNSWGNNLYVEDLKEVETTKWRLFRKNEVIKKVVGKIGSHMSPKPKVGDEVQAKMNSGKVGRFLVTDIRNCSGVSDMFFGDVEAIGYLD